MQLSSRPLYDTAADRLLYVERGVEEQVRRSVAAGLNVLVVGARRSGKTSLGYRLAGDLKAAGTQVIVIDGTVYADERALLDALSENLPKRVPSLTEQFAASLPAFDETYTTRLTGRLDELDLLGLIERRVKELRDRAPGWQGTTPVFVIDGMPTPADAHKLFGRHRDLVWRIPATWVVTGSDDQRASFLRPPADSFFDTVVELGAIDPRTQQEILARRIEKGRNVDPTIFRPQSTPGDLVARARAVLLEGRAPADFETSEFLGAVDRAAGRPGAMLAIEMSGLGAVSASDERLQRRLGWTRSRLNQVLRSLENAGLVRTSYAEPTGPGRPQKLYELVKPVDEVGDDMRDDEPTP